MSQRHTHRPPPASARAVGPAALTGSPGPVWAVLSGAAAGAAGTTALNAVTYADMVLRGRGASSTPEDTVEKLSKVSHVAIPGDATTRKNRVAGLGPMTGLVAGVGVGAALGLAQGAGWRPGLAVSALAGTVGALIGSNGPMTVLGITDPRTWAAKDWASDIVPHLAYGVVTAGVLRGLLPIGPRPKSGGGLAAE